MVFIANGSQKWRCYSYFLDNRNRKRSFLLMKHITVIGLGAGELDQLPLGLYRMLEKNTKRLFVRTANIPYFKNYRS